MKKSKSILWGIVLIALGILAILNFFDVKIDVFFDGWWTLFMIVPGVIGLFTDKDKIGALCLTGIGTALLLSSQNILSFNKSLSICGAIVVLVWGFKLIFKDGIRNKSDKIVMELNENGESLKQYNAVFSGQTIELDGEVFDGANTTAVFGGIDIKLNNAIINKDAVINIFTMFGGVDVFLPDNVNVKISSNSIFGGVSNKKSKAENAEYTVYINATCIFGGVDIK